MTVKITGGASFSGIIRMQLSSYFFLDSFVGSGNLSTHTGESGGTWSDASGEFVTVVSNPQNMLMKSLPVPVSLPFGYTLTVKTVIRNGTRLIAAATASSTGGNPTALAYTGIYTSDDDGDTWTQRYTAKYVANYTPIVAMGASNLVLGDDASGFVYISSNNGTSWTALRLFTNTGTILNNEGTQATFFAYKSTATTRLLATVNGQGGSFYTSTNNGSSWTLLTNHDALYPAGVTDPTFVGTDFSFSQFSVFDNMNAVLYRSPDGVNANWTAFTVANTALTAYIGGGALTYYTAFTPGSGYANNTYPAEPLTGGSGTGATADIVVTGGAVTSITIVGHGTGYLDGDILTATLAGGGSGFNVTVTTNGVTFNNCWQIASNVWIISVYEQYVADALDLVGADLGLWRLEITTGGSPGTPGVVTGTQISNIFADSQYAGNSNTAINSSIGSGVLVAGDLLLANGSGYTNTYMTTAANPGSPVNTSYTFTPYEWGVMLVANRPRSMFYSSGELLVSMSRQGPLDLGVGPLVGLGTGTAHGSPPAQVALLDAAILSAGAVQLQTNETFGLFSPSSLIPPSGNFYVEADIDMDITSHGWFIGFNLGNPLGAASSVGVNSYGLAPYNKFTTLTQAATARWVAPYNSYNDSGISSAGVHTLRCEVTNSGATIATYFDTVLQRQITHGPNGVDQNSPVPTPSGTGYATGTYLNVPMSVNTGSGTGAQYHFQVAQGVTNTLTINTGGSGYVDGFYSCVPLTGGTGTLAFADFTVSGGIVTLIATVNTHADVTGTGTGYTTSDILTVSNVNLGGTGSGFATNPIGTVQQSLVVDGAATGSGYAPGQILTITGTTLGGSGSGFSYTIPTVVTNPTPNNYFQLNYYPGSDFTKVKILEIRGGSI